MTACKRVRAILGAGLARDASAEAHLQACSACAQAATGFARLDALMRTEPPPPPIDIAARLGAIVEGRRAVERARARRQLASLLVAASLVFAAAIGVLELASPLGMTPSALATDLPLDPIAWGSSVDRSLGELPASPESALRELPATLLAGLQSALASAGGAVPSLPLLVPALLAPLLLLANRTMARAPSLSRAAA